MSANIEQRYSERLRRYTTAMNNQKPDRVPLRPFVAEFAAKYAGINCQQATHDFEGALAATRKCATDFDWDATVGNMIYVWTGLTEAIGLTYYGAPGIHVPADVGFQYREPAEDNAHMRADEYDALIADPTGFLFNTWLPRVSKDVAPIGGPSTYRNNLAFVKGGMAMLNYFTALGAQNERLKNECGTVSAIGGILKAPLDILGDKLRGYYGLTNDLIEQPEKVLAACRALMPHLMHVALTSADPEKTVPITIWMHRGCVPFVTPHTFETIYWPTLRPIIETLWAHGYQTLFYAEGNWDAHLDTFTELPEGSIIFHIDRSDYQKAHKALHHKFALSGGIPNTVLSLGAQQEVRDWCKRLIDEIGADGGFIMDASAIVQNDATVENVRVLTEFTREYGVYRNGPSVERLAAPTARPCDEAAIAQWAKEFPAVDPAPGICVPWEGKRGELKNVLGDETLVKRVWNDIEGFAYTFIWHCLVSF
ncbi:MAG: hypothetical protein IT366_18455 [Candidatus Hydrogenedentes bacterium]|nr:hypothetical protein [Candidatus Hydrogenedentota bacterium]